jgi:hypothetical protein
MSGTGKPFTKGVSGNPGGRPKGFGHIKEMALKKCPNILKRLEYIANQDVDLRAAVAACTKIMEYGVGKPAQTIDLTNSDGSLSAAWMTALRGIDAGEPDGHQEATVQH